MGGGTTRWRTRRFGSFLVLCALLSLSACGGRRGVYHVVRPGENLYRIGKAYGVPHAALAKSNRIRDPSRIYPGQRLFVPGAGRRVPVNVVTPRDDPGSRKRRGADPKLPAGERPFSWPLREGILTSRFGPRGRSFHDGIDIAAAAGTPVHAAADGEVVYADTLAGYGRLIIVRHPDGYATVYAHNRENRVRQGQRVRRGQVIAAVGDSGRATAPNLHFEVRVKNTARNPLYFLRPTDEVRLASGKHLR